MTIINSFKNDDEHIKYHDDLESYWLVKSSRFRYETIRSEPLASGTWEANFDNYLGTVTVQVER